MTMCDYTGKIEEKSMLVEFRVKNYGCFRDEQVLSFVPVREKSLQEENIYKTGCVDIQALLLVAVVYGANGGGKSTLLSALQSMLAISSFAEETDTTYRIPVKPFLFDEESRKNPTEFEIFFLHEGYIYQYVFSCTEDRILDEYLFCYAKTRRQTIFDRHYDKINDTYVYKFGKYLHGKKKTLCTLTNEKNTFLCIAAKKNNQLFSVWSKLISLSTVITKKNFPDNKTVNKNILTDKILKDRICSFFYSSDIPIKDIEINTNNENYIALFKYGKNDNKFFITEEDESYGIIQLYKYLHEILNALEKGSVICIDNLDSGLHPILMERLVYTFQMRKRNPYGAQLLFLTHDISLLRNDPQILRRDQIWFVERHSDLSSHLYSLAEFRRSRETDFAKIYMNGLVGGVPTLSDWE